MKKFKYAVLTHTKGEVEAKDVREATKKALDKYYEKFDPSQLDFQFLTIQVEEIKQ